MRVFSIIIGSLAAVLGFFLSFLFGSFAYIPVIIGITFGIIAIVISRKNGLRENVPKLIVALSFLAGAITTMNLFRENKVEVDVEQIEKEEQRQEKDLQEIEDLEGSE